MQEHEKDDFELELVALLTYYKEPVSDLLIESWWRAMKSKGVALEQIKKAFWQHAMTPPQGKWFPKLADIVEILEGTKTDRSMIAWGKVQEAMSSVGSYRDVVFDDPAIHAVIEDLGGWPNLCRTLTSELGYVQTRFCKSYQAYSGREDLTFLPFLAGDRSPDEVWAKRGLKPPMPQMVGNQSKCERVYKLGNQRSERISHVDQLIPENLRLTVEGAA